MSQKRNAESSVPRVGFLLFGKIHNFPRNSPADFTQYVNDDGKDTPSWKKQDYRAVPVYGFGLGPTKSKAKNPAMKMADGFAIAAAAARAARLKCRTQEFFKIMGPLVANDKTKELVTVKLQNNLYLSVVRRRFDIVIVCQ